VNAPIINPEVQWREAAHALLAACLTGATKEEIQRLAMRMRLARARMDNAFAHDILRRASIGGRP